MKADNAEKKARATDLKSQGLISEDDLHRTLRRLEMITAENTPEVILKGSNLWPTIIDNAESGKRPLVKAEAEALAETLGCPPGVVYAIAHIASDDEDPGPPPPAKAPSVTMTLNADNPVKKRRGRGPGKKTLAAAQKAKLAVPAEPPPAPAKRPKPKLQPKSTGKKRGRPPFTGHRQKEAVSIAEAAAQIRMPNPELLGNMGKQEALERLAKLCVLASQLLMVLARPDPEQSPAPRARRSPRMNTSRS